MTPRSKNREKGARYKIKGIDITDGIKTEIVGFVDFSNVLHITKEKKTKWKPKKIYFSKMSDPEEWSRP